MSAQSCPRFASCSAPLCPMDEGSLRHAAWILGEPVCTARREPWVLRQRRIARRLGTAAGFFTVAMLDWPCRITKALKGYDGEHPITTGMVQDWKRRHPAVTDAERARIGVQLSRGRRFQRAPAVPEGQNTSRLKSLAAEAVSFQGGGR